MSFEPVIGLEIHAQLLTETKIFCGCRISFGAPPNSLVCPVCLGLPGALPVLNSAAVDLALAAALALGCRVLPVSVFARKNYFYPDLPKGYQISQYDRPLAVEGRLEYVSRGVSHRVGITRVHLEEDAGKLFHEGFADSDERSYVDFNRSGVPLTEIVTAPEIHSAADASEFFERLRAILVEIGASDGNMEEGSLRCDANVSVRRPGAAGLAPRTEVKNLNSFRFLQRALEYEIDRQSEIVRAGEEVRHDTRLWDPSAGRTVAMRAKEAAEQYRYFPEPDLPPLAVASERVARIRAALPELPEARKQRLLAEYAMPEADAAQIAASAAMTRYFEAAARAAENARAARTWVIGEVTRVLRESGTPIERMRVPPASLGRLIRLIEDGTISGSAAKAVFEEMAASGRPPDAIVEERGLRLLNDEAAVRAVVSEVIAANAKAVAQYRGGKTLAFGYLVGQVMKATGGRADPRLVTTLLRQVLDGAGSASRDAPPE